MAEDIIATMPKKAICYYRVSSAEQRKNQNIDLQKNSLRNFITGKYDVVAEFVDDGKSGKRIDNRPGFVECLDYIRAVKPAALLVYMVDRIGRFADRKDRNRVMEVLKDNKTSVDGPEDGLFNHESDDDFDDLEKMLNESRRDNERRAKRIRAGHARCRQAGGWSGGTLPYGIRYIKAEKRFERVPKEEAALNEIFGKTNDLWGVVPLTNYLNENQDRYPHRERKYINRPKHKSRWLPQTISSIIRNNFYYTGVIQPTPENLARGLRPVDTKIKFFERAVVERARRERSVRRSRNIDEKRPDRRLTHGQLGTNCFMDYLLHKIARCGRCGWHLGIAPRQHKPNGSIYRYYRCQNRQTGDCNLPSMSAAKLDQFVWKQFVKILSDPAAMQKSIMQGDFLVDTDRRAQQALLRKAEKDLPKLNTALERAKNMYQWGDYDLTRYEQEKLNLNRDIDIKQREIAKLKKQLNQPNEIKAAVKIATQTVASQMEQIANAERMEELVIKMQTAINSNERNQLEEELEQMGRQQEMLIDAQAVNWMKNKVPGPEFKRKVNELVFKQKRALLQQFLDLEDKNRGLRIHAKDKAEIYISIKSLEHSSIQAKAVESIPKTIYRWFGAVGADVFD